LGQIAVICAIEQERQERGGARGDFHAPDKHLPRDTPERAAAKPCARPRPEDANREAARSRPEARTATSPERVLATLVRGYARRVLTAVLEGSGRSLRLGARLSIEAYRRIDEGANVVQSGGPLGRGRFHEHSFLAPARWPGKESRRSALADGGA
jgi:hypothetical protein